jgi:hypothetical protein
MLLERSDQSASSDFYTYRYLATEGSLPGYNFPRLPLYATFRPRELGGLRPPICNGRAFLVSPSLALTASFTARVAPIGCRNHPILSVGYLFKERRVRFLFDF